jgi:ABC-type uncharacterized transport system substrate-binding protein
VGPHFDQVTVSECFAADSFIFMLGDTCLRWTLCQIVIISVLVVGASTAAKAHPHVFVKARSEILFDRQGRMIDIRHVWQFDPAFSAFASQGLDKNADGKLSAAELAPLAKTNVQSLKYYGFFTWLTVDKRKIKLKFPDKYFLRDNKGLLTLYYELPVAVPTPPGPTMTLEVYDPEYFVAFTFAKKNPITLYNAPPGCKAAYHPPHPLDAKIMAELAAVPVSQHDLPPALKDAAVGLANLIKISCPK